MSSVHPAPPSEGEILGAVLLGLVRSFKSIEAISGNTAAALVDGLEPGAWYPMTHFFTILDSLGGRDVDYDPILFQAGGAFIQGWYDHGHGREIVHCVTDFLAIQGTDAGYAAVHRGAPEVVGSQTLLELDVEDGRAVIVGINPYPSAFEHGIFTTGMQLAGDVAHCDVTWVETPERGRLNRKVYTLRFKRKDPAAEAAADLLIASANFDGPDSVADPAVEALSFRCRALETRLARDRAFYEQSNLLLSRATDEIFELSHRLEALAHHDELTGLLNRRAMFECAHRLLALAERQGAPVSVAMMDLDNFKQINDTYGHAAGDRALCTVAETLQARLRASDLVGRIGGEEFLILLADTDLEGATQLTDGLRAAVENPACAHTAGLAAPLTISAGVAVAAPGDDDLEALIQRADKALYAAKQAGRNRVTAFAPA